jgi:hypothetical protein
MSATIKQKVFAQEFFEIIDFLHTKIFLLWGVFGILSIRNSVCFFQFRIFCILYGIAQNSAKLCRILDHGINLILWNFAESATFGAMKFRIIVTLLTAQDRLL